MLANLKLTAIATVLAVGAALTTVELASAQGTRGSLNQSRGTNLRNTYSGGISGNSGAAGAPGNTRGLNAFGQARGAMSGLGTANSLGVSGQGGVGQGPMAAGLAQSAGERFQAGGFVGRDADDVRNSFQSQNARRGTSGVLDSMIENLNEMRDSRRRWREQSAAPPPIKVQLRPEFDVPVQPPLQANAPLQSRLTREFAAAGASSTQIEIAGRTAVIRGVVATPRDRELIARLAMLEPGVSAVENLVEIQEPPSTTP